MRQSRVLFVIPAFALVACQVAGASVAVATLCCLRPDRMATPTAASTSTATVDEEECHCVHGPDAMCPMHHKSQTLHTTGSAAPRGPRWCANCCDTGQAVLTVLTALVGPPEQRHEIEQPDAVGLGPYQVGARVRNSHPSPEIPPPRV